MSFDPLKKIREAKDDFVTVVPVPEWGIVVQMKSPAGSRRAELERFTREHGDERGRLGSIDFRGIALSLTVSGAREWAENGKPIDFQPWSLTVEEASEIARDKNTIPVERLFDKSLELLGVTPATKAAVEKN